jgi:hypothetical protein
MYMSLSNNIFKKLFNHYKINEKNAKLCVAFVFLIKDYALLDQLE